MKRKRVIEIILVICMIITSAPVMNVKASDNVTLLRKFASGKTYLGSNGITYHGYINKTYWNDGIGFQFDYCIESIPMLPISYRIDDYDEDGEYELLVVCFDSKYSAILEMYEVDNDSVVLKSSTQIVMNYSTVGISLELDQGKFNCFTYSYNGKKVIGVEESGCVWMSGDGCKFCYSMVKYDGTNLVVLGNASGGGSYFEESSKKKWTEEFKRVGVILDISNIISLKHMPSDYIDDKIVFASVNHDTPRNTYELYKGKEFDGRIDNVSNITFTMMNTEGINISGNSTKKIEESNDESSSKNTSSIKKKKVAGFKAKAGKKKATLSWKKLKGATGYKIYMKTSSKGKLKLIKTTKKTSFNKSKLKSKKSYYFVIKAYKKSGGRITYSKPVLKKVKVK